MSAANFCNCGRIDGWPEGFSINGQRNAAALAQSTSSSMALTGPTAEGVSRATTRTVVNSALAVLALDYLLTAFMF